jgi:hypothetical protein
MKQIKQVFDTRYINTVTYGIQSLISNLTKGHMLIFKALTQLGSCFIKRNHTLITLLNKGF